MFPALHSPSQSLCETKLAINMPELIWGYLVPSSYNANSLIEGKKTKKKLPRHSIYATSALVSHSFKHPSNFLISRFFFFGWPQKIWAVFL